MLTPEKIIGYNLRRLRQIRGWKQRQVADMYEQLSGRTCNDKYISAMERGSKWPGKATIWRFAAIYKIHPSELVKPPYLENLSFLVWEKIDRIMENIDRGEVFLRMIEVFLHWDDLREDHRKEMCYKIEILHDYLFQKVLEIEQKRTVG